MSVRLFGTESHPLIGNLRVLSYVCVGCDAVRVDMETLPKAPGQLSRRTKEPATPKAKLLAKRRLRPRNNKLVSRCFDKAWQTVKTSS
jgi:hypothetical protein